MEIVTQHIYPPIPLRQFDWCATDRETYDGEGCPIGFGATEQEAIGDLIEQIGTDMTREDLSKIPRVEAAEMLVNIPAGPGYEHRVLLAVESAMNIEWWRGHYAGYDAGYNVGYTHGQALQTVDE